MGEEKKEEGKKEDEKKKEEEEEEIVVKVDMHCEACARKVTRALKGFQGVEEVKTDCKAGKVVVKGKVAAADPIKVCQRIQKKTGRKVQLISPLPNLLNIQQPKPTTAPQNNPQPPPAAVITVVLKVGMHCEACAQVLQKRIKKIKGVESVTTDMGKDHVIVKGVVNPEELVKDVYKRSGKQASIVKEEEEKKEEKKDDEKKQDEKKDVESKDNDDDDKKTDVKKMEYWPQKHYMDYAYAHAPQMFSDENPNACSIM